MCIRDRLVAEYGVFQEMHMLPCLWRDSSKQIQRFLIASRQITIQHASQQHGVVRNYNICNLATTQVVDRNLQVGAPSQFLPDIHLGDGGSQLLVGSNAVRDVYKRQLQELPVTMARAWS